MPNEPHTQPPSWLDELRISLLSPERRWSPDSALDLLSAGDEFEGWLHDRRAYDRQHKNGWRSAIADLRHSADQIGPQLRHALKPELGQVLQTADQLATSLPARPPDDRAVYAAFKARWHEPLVRGAAWQDLVAACQDDTTSFDTLATRRDLFWQTMRFADYDIKRLSNLLAGILQDGQSDVSDAEQWLGASTAAQLAVPGPLDQPANLTEQQRLALCERLITQPPQIAHRVVWLAFDRTGPQVGFRDLGVVQFWHSELLNAVADHGSDSSGAPDIPPELSQSPVTVARLGLPVGPALTLARVDLGVGAFTDPARLAAEQAEAIVAVAGFRADELRWRRLDGSADLTDGRPYRTTTFNPPNHWDDLVSPDYTRFMAAQLDHLALQLAPHLPITDPDLTEIIQAVRWWQQARDQPPLAGVLLDVRILELIASRLGQDWKSYLGRHLRTTWIYRSVIGQLTNVVYTAVSKAQLSVVAHGLRVAELREAIVSVTGDGITLNWRQCLATLPELAGLFPLHTQPGRYLRTLDARLSSVTNLQSWCDERADEWSRLLQRLDRLRNALAHGGPFQNDGLASVSQFGRQLAAYALSLTLEGILAGKTIATVHAEYAQQQDARWQRRTEAASVAEVLFDP